MALRLFIHFYFILYSIGLMLSAELSNPLFRGLVFILSLLYIANRMMQSGKKIFIVKFESGIFIFYLYIILYSFLFFTKSSNSIGAYAMLPVLIVHSIFWHLVSSSKIYLNDYSKLFYDIFLSFIFTFIFFLICTLNHVNFILIPGSLHDLAPELSMIWSDLDVPLLSLICCVFLFARYNIANSKYESGYRLKKYQSILVFLLIIFTLWMYSRRAPIFLLLIVILLMINPFNIRKKMMIFYLFIPIVPYMWNSIASLLIIVMKNDYINAFLARNRIEDYLTATNRLYLWLDGYRFMFNFQLSHLFGYGGSPWKVLDENNDHVHNSILSLFFDAGLVTLAVYILLIIIILYRILYMMKNKIGDEHVVNFFVIFYNIFIILSIFESLLMSYSLSHLIFITFSITLLNYYNTNKINMIN